MQQKGRVILRVLVLLVLFFHSFSVIAAIPHQVQLSADKVILTLPKMPGQAFKVTSTPHPMKIIVDSNSPLTGFAEAQSVNDVALGQLRSFRMGDGQFRLVLDFNYQLPEFFVFESEQELRVEVLKTFVHTSERVVARGIVYGHQRRADSFGPNVVNYLKVDLSVGNQVKLALAQNRILGSENVSALAERYGAVAAINGAFFDGNGRPVGIVVVDGQIISEPFAGRTALGLGPQGPLLERVDWRGEILSRSGVSLAAISGVNRPRLTDELIVYTPHYGSRTATNVYGSEVTVVNGVVTALGTGNSDIPKDGVVLSGHGLNRQPLSSLRVGDEITIDLRLDPPWIEQGITQIIGGGPGLVRDGLLVNSGEEESFRADVLQGRAPRTAIGITAQGQLLLVTVNGRQPNISVGMTLAELGRLLIELGAVQGMNLDGGGSTTMVIHDLVLNLPSNGKERPVSNAILILAPKSR